MELHDYEKLASRTLLEKPDFTLTDKDVMIVWNAIGLSGEAGEILEHIKKGIFHQHGIEINQLKKELGDCLWYIAALCHHLEITLSDVAWTNLEKLAKRYPNGYNPTDSKIKLDCKPQ